MKLADGSTNGPAGAVPVTLRLLPLAVTVAVAELSPRLFSFVKLADIVLLSRPLAPCASSALTWKLSLPPAGRKGTVVTTLTGVGHEAPPDAAHVIDVTAI
ncbi:MAG TPA: hypothetical protein PLG77_03535 [Burkholderiaceae bacterium]|nr:hypothetical protein [Burkholderiaceae bacterium]